MRNALDEAPRRSAVVVGLEPAARSNDRPRPIGETSERTRCFAGMSRLDYAVNSLITMEILAQPS